MFAGSLNKPDAVKKPCFEEMSKEQLLENCKNMYTVAQRIRTTRDELVLENSRVKKQLEASKDMIDTLTQQKLELSQNVQLLREQNAIDTSSADKIEGLKRQNKRLEDENEDLLGKLDKLDEEQMKNAKLSETIARNEEILKNYRVKMSKLASMVKELKQNKREVLETSKEYSSYIVQWQEELKRLSAIVSDQTEQNSRDSSLTHSDLNVEIERNETLKREIDTLKMDKECHEARLRSLNETIDKYKRAESEWKVEIDRAFVGARVENVENTLARPIVDELRAKINDITAHTSVLKQEIVRLIEKTNQQNENEVQLTEIANELQSARALNDEKTTEINALETERMRLNEKINSLTDELSRANALLIETKNAQPSPQSLIELKSQKIITADLKKQIVELNANVAELTKEKQSGLADLQTLNRKNGDLLKELKKSKGELERAQQKIADVNVSLEQKCEVIRVQQAEIMSLSGKLESLEKTHATNVEEMKRLTNQLVELNEDVQNNEAEKRLLKENVNKLTVEVEALKQGKKPQHSEVEAMRKDKQAVQNALDDMKKKSNQLQTDVEKLNVTLKSNEKLLDEEKRQHAHTRELLDKSRKECREKNMLTLEMGDYEKSLKDLKSKLDDKNHKLTASEEKIAQQNDAMKTLQSQIAKLTDELTQAKLNGEQLTGEVEALMAKKADIEGNLTAKTNAVTDMELMLQTERVKLDEMTVKLSEAIAANQRASDEFKNEREQFKGVIFGLKEKIQKLEEKSTIAEQELTNVRADYDAYKTRAGSLLRQNKATNGDDDVEHYQQLVDDLTIQTKKLNQQLEQRGAQIQELNDRVTTLMEEKTEIDTENANLHKYLDSMQREHNELLEAHARQAAEHAETLRTQKLGNDTLNQCYKQQIADIEEKYTTEIARLTKVVEKWESNRNNTTRGRFNSRGEDGVDVKVMEREEGEGSESIESSASATNMPIPFDELLNMDTNNTKRPSNLNGELTKTRQELSKNEARVTHLTELLADAEKDLAKLTQLNHILKEEIRRQQRSVEREQHAENLEYLKNVIFKFITLTNYDEKKHLVPVLNTILKLSPEESHKLDAVAKGLEPYGNSWTSYIPVPKWPGT